MAFDLLILLEKKEQKTFTLPEIETILHAYLNEAEN